MKVRYEVRTIQKGIPYWNGNDEEELEEYSDEVVTTVHGSFQGLDDAKIMAKALEEKIAEGADYVISRYTPEVVIVKITEVEEIDKNKEIISKKPVVDKFAIDLILNDLDCQIGLIRERMQSASLEAFHSITVDRIIDKSVAQIEALYRAGLIDKDTYDKCWHKGWLFKDEYRGWKYEIKEEANGLHRKKTDK